MESTLPILCKRVLPTTERIQADLVTSSPIRILQIGEGNFLRGFVDWMLHKCIGQGLYDGSVAITQPRSSGASRLMELRSQEGLYTLVSRGLVDGEPVIEREIISVFSAFIDPYQEWDEFLAISILPKLEVIVSNTTEAGLEYHYMAWEKNIPADSYPARLTQFLFHRFTHYDGDPTKGLVILPCELVEDNGTRLLVCVCRHASDWGLSLKFQTWLKECNTFVNSLVDRIVTGYPDVEGETWCEQWGYRDSQITVAEPYHLWAIQGDPRLEAILPFTQAGLNVHWVDDLGPYQIRKLRILNAAHTLMALLGLLQGVRTVREAVEHEKLAGEIWTAITLEIIPFLPSEIKGATEYARDTWERFRNPYLQHRLTDIVLNSVSKYRQRLLPSLLTYQQNTGNLPLILVHSLACLILLYEPSTKGKPILVRDNIMVMTFFEEIWNRFRCGDIDIFELIRSTLSADVLWNQDLNRIPGLSQILAQTLLERMLPI